MLNKNYLRTVMKLLKPIRLLFLIFILFVNGCSSDYMELIFRNPFNITDGLVSIRVTPLNSSVPLGHSVQYYAKGNYLGGSTIDITDNVAWTSNNKNIAKVSNRYGPKGSATTHNIGSTTITASIGQFSGNASLTVTEKIIENFIISPIASSVPMGIDQQFTATAYY